MQNHDRNAPIVTVGLPVYNGAKYLIDALHSVLSQSFKNFELIISDNASDDKTPEICHEYTLRDSRIKYIRQSENIGSHANFMYVLNQAYGEYFTWFAHDDYLETSCLEKLSAYLSVHPKVVLVASDFTIMDAEGTTIKHEFLETIRGDIPWHKRQIEFFTHPITNVYFCIYGMMRTSAGKSIAEKYRTPKSRLLTGGERPILSRLAMKGEIVSIPHTLRKYRNHPISSYFTEVNKLSKLPPLKRKYELNLNINSLRLDQILVILESGLSIVTKTRILLKLLVFYLIHFTKKLFLMPINLGKFIEEYKHIKS